MRIGKLLGILVLLTISTGCATLNRSNSQARAGRVESAQVDIVSIPYDSSLPKYVVVVDPFEFNVGQHQYVDASGRTQSYSFNFSGDNTASNKLAAQMRTALSNAGNISLVDLPAARRLADGTVRTKLQKGEKGPYILRATITELDEVAEKSGQKRGASLAWLGVVLGVAGFATNHPGLGWTGAGIAGAAPTFSSESEITRGNVAIDMTLVDGKTGRIVKAFQVAGTATSQTAENSVSIFGIGGTDSEMAKSSLDQAMRAAINDAVHETMNALKAGRV